MATLHHALNGAIRYQPRLEKRSFEGLGNECAAIQALKGRKMNYHDSPNQPDPQPRNQFISGSMTKVQLLKYLRNRLLVLQIRL